MMEKDRYDGVYKLQLSDFANVWTYYLYRVTNGVLEAKMRDKIDEWEVINEIPEGAQLVTNEK